MIKKLILLINSFDTFSYNIINNTLNEIVTNNNYIFKINIILLEKNY